MHLSVEMVSSITLDPYSIIKSLMEASFTYLKIGLPPRLTELHAPVQALLSKNAATF
jgi:hypothetical protein